MLPVKITHPFKQCGMFGAKRKYDIHTGIDMYCEVGSPVFAVNGGTVREVIQFTGEEVGSPWWNKTYAVAIDDGMMTVVYGEIEPLVKEGDVVFEGQCIGAVLQVLKEDKGVTPTSMLHLEVWFTQAYMSNFTWNIGEAAPFGLCDPTLYVHPTAYRMWAIKTENGYLVEDEYGEYMRFFNHSSHCKDYLLDEEHTFLSKSSPIEDKVDYTLSTGKSLWFDE